MQNISIQRWILKILSSFHVTIEICFIRAEKKLQLSKTLNLGLVLVSLFNGISIFVDAKDILQEEH